MGRTPQTFEKRQRERLKQRKRDEKLERRLERNAEKKLAKEENPGEPGAPMVDAPELELDWD